MNLTIHKDLEQGTDAWHQARCGLITCSELNLILTPTLKPANNENTRKHIYELAAQRITQYVEPTYIGDNMLRGWEDEIKARDLYSNHYEPVKEVGGMVRDFGGYRVWGSPDGLVGDEGGIECKSRIQKYQIQAIASGDMPEEFALQVQGLLWISGREWWDFISYSGGLPMFVKRVLPDERYQQAIRDACESTEEKIQKVIDDYHNGLRDMPVMIETERNERDMEVF